MKKMIYKNILKAFMSFLVVNTTTLVGAEVWEVVGTAGFSNYQPKDTSIKIGSNDTPYVAYSDNKANVKKFDGTNWVSVGNPNFSAGDVYQLDLAIDNNGIPYVTYADPTEIYKMTVMKYHEHNNTWGTLGPAGFSSDQSTYVSIAIDNNNTPYVAFSEQGHIVNTSSSRVMKYNGTEWIDVGEPGFPGSGSNLNSLAINSSGTPYILFYDSNKKSTVMKFDGVSWITVGSPSFSIGVLSSESIALVLDSKDTPYVAYSNRENHEKANVMKFDGSSWVSVGSPDFSTHETNYISLAIDSGDTLYVAYQSERYDYNATVRKYTENNNSWDSVGNEKFSAGEVRYLSLTLNSRGTPYVSYQDYGNNYKTTVMSAPFVKCRFVQGTSKCFSTPHPAVSDPGLWLPACDADRMIQGEGTDTCADAPLVDFIGPYLPSTCPPGTMPIQGFDTDGCIDNPACIDNDGDGYYAQANCGTAIDCNDNASFLNPSTSEICNGVDDNCDGQVDELENLSAPVDSCTQEGVCSGTVWQCIGFNGWVCDYQVNPDYEDHETICDGLDNDCDRQIDEGGVCP